MTTFVFRVLGALRLDGSIYENIEADRGAIWQAATVVVLSSLAAGLGVGGLYERTVSSFVLTSAVSLVGWMAWAMLTLQIGTRLLPVRDTHADFGELMRTIGFAAAPGLLQIFAVFPRMTRPIVAVSAIWMFAAMVVAVERALDYRNVGRAVAVCAIAAALSIGLAVILATVLISPVG